MFSVIFLNVTSTEEQLQISLEELLQTEVSDNSDEKNEKCDQRPQWAVNSTKDKQVDKQVENIGYAKTPGIKKFECLTCVYSCKSTINMDRHILTHTGEKLFICPYCGSAFIQKANMTVHVNRLHTK